MKKGTGSGRKGQKKQIGDVLLLRGSVQIALCDLQGNILRSQIINNTVVTVGRVFVLKQLQTVNHVTSHNFSHIGIGSDDTAPATSQTALGLEVTRKAISSFDTTNLTANPPNWQAQVQFATNEGNTTLKEVAILNSSAGGTMLARATFASFVKATSNVLNFSYNITG
jgi:hypothetical protein